METFPGGRARGDGSTASVPWLVGDELPLLVWGSGRDGQLGLGPEKLAVPTPVRVPATWELPHQHDAQGQGPPPLVQVDCGYRHTAMVSVDRPKHPLDIGVEHVLGCPRTGTVGSAPLQPLCARHLTGMFRDGRRIERRRPGVWRRHSRVHCAFLNRTWTARCLLLR
jgi:hypothetical protein